MEQNVWQPIETAPKEVEVLVWYDHDADTYYCPEQPNKLTNYAAWAEGGDFFDFKGYTVAKLLPQHWESVDEYGAGYFLPEAWFAGPDYDVVVNALFWAPLPPPP